MLFCSKCKRKYIFSYILWIVKYDLKLAFWLVFCVYVFFLLKNFLLKNKKNEKNFSKKIKNFIIFFDQKISFIQEFWDYYNFLVLENLVSDSRFFQ
jgi:predicted AlkP superfamily phosphohydrolase/phosphomutase